MSNQIQINRRDNRSSEATGHRTNESNNVQANPKGISAGQLQNDQLK